MKNVFIVSELVLYNSASAGAARMMNFAKALTLEGVNVYLCSKQWHRNVRLDGMREIEPKIFLVGSENQKEAPKPLWRRNVGSKN